MNCNALQEYCFDKKFLKILFSYFVIILVILFLIDIIMDSKIFFKIVVLSLFVSSIYVYKKIVIYSCCSDNRIHKISIGSLNCVYDIMWQPEDDLGLYNNELQKVLSPSSVGRPVIFIRDNNQNTHAWFQIVRFKGFNDEQTREICIALKADGYPVEYDNGEGCFIDAYHEKLFPLYSDFNKGDKEIYFFDCVSWGSIEKIYHNNTCYSYGFKHSPLYQWVAHVYGVSIDIENKKLIINDGCEWGWKCDKPEWGIPEKIGPVSLSKQQEENDIKILQAHLYDSVYNGYNV